MATLVKSMKNIEKEVHLESSSDLNQCCTYLINNVNNVNKRRTKKVR